MKCDAQTLIIEARHGVAMRYLVVELILPMAQLPGPAVVASLPWGGARLLGHQV